MNEVKTYNCPSCGAPLIFDPKSGGLKCEYCDLNLSPEDSKEYIDSIEFNGEKESYSWDDHNKESGSGDWSEEEKSSMRTYVCPSCGGEIIGDEHTVATVCPYCDNPTVMSENTRDVFKPDVIIAFKHTKEEAKAALAKHYLKRPLLPKCFKDRNKIEEVKGIYVPFWFFDCDTDSDMTYNATRVRTWSTSDYIYTETSHYLIRRSGKLSFSNIPADGSSKIDDTIMQAIEPFNADEMKDFSYEYLSGFLADKYDVDFEKVKPYVNERVKNTVSDTLRNTVVGYHSVIPRSSDIRLSQGKIKYGLMPVYLLTTNYNGKKYVFAMNGQTGKFVGDLPVSPKRFAAYFGGIFAASAAVISALVLML